MLKSQVFLENPLPSLNSACSHPESAKERSIDWDWDKKIPEVECEKIAIEITNNFVAMVGKEDPCHASYTPRLEWNPQVFDYLSQAYGAPHFANISQALT